jgi:hypothetical protein
MPRPAGVTLIACFFLVIGTYYCAIATGTLLIPAAIHAIRWAPAVEALTRVSPYWTLSIGAAWCLVGCGLLGLQDWARWAAQIMLGIGVAWTLPMIYFKHIHFGWRMLTAFAQIVLELVAVGYLFSPAIMGAFLAKRTARGSAHQSPPRR